ncbi:hypothetical protein KKC67_01535 [Patescibacteria group bacterium]|nr:hypothetical protein [Patescibacteria group bacterium]MBU0879841.1 hypothetical protein [Patescibacteria group bacterium]MBU0880475.1 hypothetical protein [Patescibacteria group bacterium]MBU0897960.1 hypothetical protein [Patescibacteria group bacterium]MBU1062900.1 hypothetical protein [Patescibacteria group bacterium]
MTEDKGLEKLGDLFNLPVKTKKLPAYQWQDLALQIIRELEIPNNKRNSVFRVCKLKSRAVILGCLNDTKELCKTGQKWSYFFKLTSGGCGNKELGIRN